MPHNDLDKRRESCRKNMRAWIERNPEEHRKRSRESMQRWVAANPDKVKESNRKVRENGQKWWNGLKKGLKCSKCGENHLACIEFHHKKPNEKELNISHYSRGGWHSRKKLILELYKCEVLCANCHRKEHFIDDRQIKSDYNKYYSWDNIIHIVVWGNSKII